jgi:polyisoprenoid-binding protein YceI
MSLYSINSLDSKINFSIKHLMISKVHGSFKIIKGQLLYDPHQPEKLSVDVTIDVSSINTKDKVRDDHLKSEDFFNIKNFPYITFISHKVTVSGDRLKIFGILNIRDIKKEIMIDSQKLRKEKINNAGSVYLMASGITRIKRKDFALTWSAPLEAGGILVGDEVQLDFQVKFIEKK